MKNKLFTFIIICLLFVPSVFADVDLYLKGQEYWKWQHMTLDSSIESFKNCWRQKQKGEVVDFFTAGYDAGSLVIPPKFVKITITGVTYEQVKEYVQPLYDPSAERDSDSMMVKERRFFFKRALVDSAQALWESDSSTITVTKQQAKNLIKTYDIATVKQKIIDRLKE